MCGGEECRREVGEMGKKMRGENVTGGSGERVKNVDRDSGVCVCGEVRERVVEDAERGAAFYV